MRISEKHSMQREVLNLILKDINSKFFLLISTTFFNPHKKQLPIVECLQPTLLSVSNIYKEFSTKQSKIYPLLRHNNVQIQIYSLCGALQ